MQAMCAMASGMAGVGAEQRLRLNVHTPILGLRGGVHTPSGGVNTAGVHTGNVVFTQKKWCSHSVLQHIPVDGWCVDRSERF